jgi:hypothetical protein
MEPLIQAFGLVFDPFVLAVIAVSAVFGVFVGAMPGLTDSIAGAGDLLHATSARAWRDCHCDDHGDFRRRYSSGDASHAGHASLSRLYR